MKKGCINIAKKESISVLIIIWFHASENFFTEDKMFRMIDEWRKESETFRWYYKVVLVAQEVCLTCWINNVDVDLITSNNLSSEMNHFWQYKLGQFHNLSARALQFFFSLIFIGCIKKLLKKAIRLFVLFSFFSFCVAVTFCTLIVHISQICLAHLGQFDRLSDFVACQLL